MFVNDSTKSVPPQASYNSTESDGEEFKEEEATLLDTGVLDPAGSKIKDGDEISTNPDQMKDMEADETGLKDNGNEDDKKSKKEEQPHDKNADFVDVEKTGRWGQVSKKEVYIVAIIMILIVVGVAAALVVFLGDGGSKDDDDKTEAAIKLTPILTPEEQMELIRSALKNNSLTADVWKHSNEFGNFYGQAAKWVVDADVGPFDRQADILPRFALAALYYSSNGITWLNQDRWLSDSDVCDGWYGVVCDKLGNVVELELSENNLLGDFPAGPLSLLKTIDSIRLDNNQLEGNLPDEFFETMPNLQFLYVQHNKLGGTVPESFLANGMLRTYFNFYLRLPRHLSICFCITNSHFLFGLQAPSSCSSTISKVPFRMSIAPSAKIASILSSRLVLTVLSLTAPLDVAIRTLTVSRRNQWVKRCREGIPLHHSTSWCS